MCHKADFTDARAAAQRGASASVAAAGSPPRADLTVAVIGAGFSGTLAAVHLLRSSSDLSIRVAIIERTGRFARGVAYGTSCPRHLLNVPAGRMSAFPDEPEHFVRWAGSRGLPIKGDAFAPRSLYGEYLESILHDAQRSLDQKRSLDRFSDEAFDLTTDAATGRPVVHLRKHGLLDADSVVLAMGNFPPGRPGVRDRRLLSDDAYIADPWAAGALGRVRPGKDVLLIGTGLTALDVILELQEQGHQGRVFAISRRGVIPQSHRSPSNPPQRRFVAEEVRYWPRTALGMLRQVRREVRSAATRGEDWREIINAMRPVTQRLWATLPSGEKRRFLHRIRPYWDSHRHRAAGEIHDAIEKLTGSGALEFLSGRIESSEPTAEGVRIILTPRGSATRSTLDVGSVINCTGPAPDLRAIEDPLLAGLLRRGAARADDFALGLEADERGAVIRRDGRADPAVRLIGPLRKGQLWESVAVPELREQARDVAQSIVLTCPRRVFP